MEIFIVCIALAMGVVAVWANIVSCRHKNLNWIDCDECAEPHSYPICADCGEDPYDD